MAEKLDGIDISGFSAAVTVTELKATQCKAVPENRGVYLIIAPQGYEPKFLAKSFGGWLKDKDPSIPESVLKEQWVPGARIIYVGKAGGQKGLRQRLQQYMKFGCGVSVGHWGGRYIWQLKAHNDLLVRWKEIDADPDQAETELIQAFKYEHNKRPFANLRK